MNSNNDLDELEIPPVDDLELPPVRPPRLETPADSQYNINIHANSKFHSLLDYRNNYKDRGR